MSLYSDYATFKFDDNSLSVGENLYAATYDETLEWLLYGITLWYEEYVDYDFDSQSCAENEVCEHYTQMVWDSTRYVGCGYAMCESLNRVAWTKSSMYLVCNYYPSGNIAGSDPYTPGNGTVCSNCDSDRQYCQSGLCSGCMC